MSLRPNLLAAISGVSAALPYHADAVHFAANAHLESNHALVGVANGRTGIFSTWRKGAEGTELLLNRDGEGVYITERVELFMQGAVDFARARWDDADLSDGNWHHLLISWDVNAPSGERTYQAYLDDAVQTITNISESGASGFDITYADEGDWRANNSGLAAEYADYFFAPNQFLDFSIEANRRKFISAIGKPVDLGADGSTPTGIAPAVFFSGDADNFGINKGPGGTFDLTGALTNATSPSD